VLLEHVQLAADAGFTAAMCSDRFHPWGERQSHSGLIAAAGARSSIRAALEAFGEGGDVNKPALLQVTVSFARTEDECVAAAEQQWRQCALAPEELAHLATPGAFDHACAGTAIDNVLLHVPASSAVQRPVGCLLEDAALGVDRIYLHNVAGAHQARFIEACARHLLPAFDQQPVGGNR
jgi:coenzyme F420-dependent glucose-6-phosphate dehydrogenase